MRMASAAGIALAAFVALLTTARAESLPAPEQFRIYDPDPRHPWNHLYRTLYHRTLPDGFAYDQESLEPPLSRRSKVLTQGAWHRQTLAVLDNFAKTNADTLIREPLKRAIMQRDLWTVFARIAESPHLWPVQPLRRELQRRLAKVMSRIALTPEEIQRLPDNLADAAASGRFAKAYDHEHPERPFLPGDLLRENGAWVVLCYPFGSDHVAALQHTQVANGPSAFFILLRSPGGRAETVAYLKRLGERSPPQISKGTQVAILRKMMHVDRTGTLRMTPVTESVQLRAYNDLKAPDMYEFMLKRKKLISGQAGGLIPTGSEDSAFVDLFATAEHDPFDSAKRPAPTVTMKSCIGCHAGPGIYGFQSVFQHRAIDSHVLAPHTLEGQTETIIGKTHGSYAWGLLQGMWESPPGN